LEEFVVLNSFDPEFDGNSVHTGRLPARDPGQNEVQREAGKEPQRIPAPSDHRQPSVAKLNDLTPREREVLICIADGCSTKETAARLGITFKTAAYHRYRIMYKLDVHETSTLVRFAIRSGLIEA
jgi:DNA-binding CsgD family transcriptional regulator